MFEKVTFAQSKVEEYYWTFKVKSPVQTVEACSRRSNHMHPVSFTSGNSTIRLWSTTSLLRTISVIQNRNCLQSDRYLLYIPYYESYNYMFTSSLKV